MTPGTRESRQAHRQAIREARAAFVGALAPAVRRGLESALADIVLPHLGPPGILATYAAMGDELDPAAIEARAVALGWKLAFPRVSRGEPLAFHAAGWESLAPGTLGIPEPAETAPRLEPDVLLVPLLAADAAGNRLGQGGGYYDRTLAGLRAARRVLAIGLAWDMQLVTSLESEPWDQPLDAVATPTAFHLGGAGARRRA
jgi:5-formyltetrahydrofolate cyclo-ligase